jgi:hypothetical protein
MSLLVELYVQKHKDFRLGQINAFVCDITSEQLTDSVEPSSVNIVTMVICCSPLCLFVIILMPLISFIHFFYMSV